MIYRQILFVLCIILMPLKGLNALNVNASEVVRLRGKDVKCLMDFNREFTIKTLPMNQFEKIDNPALNFQFLNGRVWMLFDIQSKNKLNHILELKNALIDHVAIYKRKNGGWVKLGEQGDRFKFDKRKIKHRFQQFEIKELGEYLISVESRGDEMALKMTLTPKFKMKEKGYRLYLLSGFYFGMLFLILTISLFMLILLPGKKTFYLFGYVLFLITLQLALTGYGYAYMWGNSPYFQNRIIMWSTCMLTIFMLLFIQNFFRTARQYKKVHFVYNLSILVMTVAFFVLFTGNTELLNGTNRFLSLSILILTISIIPLSVVVYRKRFKPARLVFIANISLAFGVFLFELYSRGFFQEYLIAEFGIYIGTCFQSSLLVIALLDSYGIYKDIAVKQSKEITSLLASKNENLQLEVNSRTKKIILQKEELEFVNKELISSINAARAIQTSLVNENQSFSSSFQESFVINLSKNIVSGDFYWTPSVTIADTKKLDKKIIVLGDTNRIGVPGAMMGVLAMRILETHIFSTKNDELNHKEILVNMDRELKSIFSNQKHGVQFELGIDLAMCCIDNDLNQLEFSGAKMNMFLWNVNETREIVGFNQSIGQLTSANSIVTSKVFFTPGDVLYVCTDGIKKELRKKECSIESLFGVFSPQDTLHIQKEKLLNYFEELFHKEGQLDDITIIGIKL